MFSWPPAITISASPSRIACAASITAFSPEPQTLLIVIAGTSCGRPALMTAWRAGFCPQPACSTWPRITSPICSPCRPDRRSKSRMTMAPSSLAGVLASVPPNLPTAVRAAATMTMSSMLDLLMGLAGGSGEPAPDPLIVGQIAIVALMLQLAACGPLLSFAGVCYLTDLSTARHAVPGTGSCCGGRRCAPTPLRCSARGRVAELTAFAALSTFGQLRRVS